MDEASLCADLCHSCARVAVETYNLTTLKATSTGVDSQRIFMDDCAKLQDIVYSYSLYIQLWSREMTGTHNSQRTKNRQKQKDPAGK